MTRLHTGFGRARHRMARDKAGAAGLPLGQHRSLDRAHIREHRLPRQGVQQRLGGPTADQGEGPTPPGRTLEHLGVCSDAVGQTPLPGPLGGGLAVHQGMDRGAARAQVQRQGAPDQPQAHDSHGPIPPQHCHRRYGLLGPASYDSAMLEARAHHQLKALLRQEGAARWPHHLTLSRLVARSLRRADQTQVRLSALSDPSWLVGLLVPLALSEAPVALVLSDELRQRLLQQELPRLKAVGLNLPCWEGESAPQGARLWLLSPAELAMAWQQNLLGERQLVIVEADELERALRQSLGIVVETRHWELLRRSLPAAEASLLALHERLSRRIFSHPSNPSLQIALSPEEEAPLGQLLQLLSPLPPPWPSWLESQGPGWTSWATVDPQLLQWTLHRQPLEPFEVMAGLLRKRGALMIGSELGGPVAPPGRRRPRRPWVLLRR
ncbi:hypothetical protein AAF143_03605 [Cyanobium sp. ATX-6F1]